MMDCACPSIFGCFNRLRSASFGSDVTVSNVNAPRSRRAAFGAVHFEVRDFYSINGKDGGGGGGEGEGGRLQ